MKEEELRLCQIQEWYPLFKPHTIPTLFHPLPDDFIRYILGQSPNPNDPPPPFFLPNSNSSETLTLTLTLAPSFPSLESAVAESISALGGAAFPKLNWSSPKDAAWISADGSLRCTSFADVALLLRASDRAVHDLCHAVESVSDPSPPPAFRFVLALRKFYPTFRPEMEFRCFVRQKRLVGVSQREVTAFYPSIVDRRGELRGKIRNFFDGVVRGRFGLEDYCFDVYVTGDGRVKVVDFNPWGGFTLGLLFGWEEMEEEGFCEEGEEVEFRIVDGRCGVRPGLKTAVPFDYLDTGEGSGWDEFLRKANEELGRQMKDAEIGS